MGLINSSPSLRPITSVFALIVLLIGCAQSKQQVAVTSPVQDAATADDIAPYLKALPPDTEALLVARGPFRTVYPNKLGVVESLRMLTTILLPMGGGPENPKAQFPPFPAVDVQVAVFGSRNFKEPKDFGLGPFEGCLFLKVTDAGGKAVQPWIERARKSKITLAEKEVSTFGTHAGNDEAQVGLYMHFENDTLFVATDKKYLETVLLRMKANSTEEAFPPNLLHWKLVNRGAKNFGLRKFVRKDGNKLYEVPDKTYKGATVEVTEEKTTVHWLASEISPLVSMDKEEWLQLESWEVEYTKLVGKPSEDHERSITYLSRISFLIGPPLYL